jgi:nickel/cobalt transporter (NicO) family protein
MRGLALLLLLTLLLPAVASANPFLPGGTRAPADTPEERRPSPPSITAPSWYGKAMVTISAWQREMRSAMSVRAREIKENPFGASFWTFLVLAFGYGAVHALGPGHGKCFAVAYFASRPARLRQTVFLGGLMPTFHVGSAVVLVLGLLYLFDTATLGNVQERSLLLQRISYLLLVLVGLFLGAKTLLEIFREDSHEPSTGCADTRSMLGLALAVGLVPCPATAIVLIFCISQDLLVLGLAASLSIGLGMALTTTMISAFTVYSRSGLAGTFSRWKRTGVILHRFMALAGSMFIAGIGLTLYLSLNGG